jgi:hypothetical protein
MPDLTFGTDSGSFTSIPATTTPYNIGSPLALGGARIVESITLDLGNSGVTSPANACAAIWNGSSPWAIRYRSASLSMNNSNRYRTFDVGANGLYLTNATYFFGVSRESSAHRISVGQQSSTTGVSRTSGDQGVSDTSLGTLNTSMSSRRLTGYITYREATVPDEPTFTLTEGYGSIAITDISTDTDAALPLTQWQIYRSPGAEIWTNISLASGNPVVDGDGAYTITGLSAGTEYSIYLRVSNAHGVSPQSEVDTSTPYGLPFMLDYDAVYDDVLNRLEVTFDADDNFAPSGVDWYHIYKSTNGGAFTFIRQTNATETLGGTYYDTAVSQGNTYRYRIYPHNDAGYGAYGETGGVLVVEEPGPVRNLNATNIGVSSVTIVWNAPLNNGGSAIDFYTITLDGVDLFDVQENVFTATITGLDPNTEYDIGVYATNTDFPGEESVLLVKTLGGLPRVYDSLTDTWLYGTIKHYDGILNEWKGITVKYYDGDTESWQSYNS